MGAVSMPKPALARTRPRPPPLNREGDHYVAQEQLTPIIHQMWNDFAHKFSLYICACYKLGVGRQQSGSRIDVDAKALPSFLNSDATVPAVETIRVIYRRSPKVHQKREPVSDITKNKLI